MDAASITHVRDEECIDYFGLKTEERNFSEYVGVEGRIILESILGK
jgi:hypothetical protein